MSPVFQQYRQPATFWSLPVEFRDTASNYYAWENLSVVEVVGKGKDVVATIIVHFSLEQAFNFKIIQSYTTV